MIGQPIQVIEDCQLEWDKHRGVLYVHNAQTGLTVLRVCGLPETQNSAELGMIDVTVKAAKAVITIAK